MCLICILLSIQTNHINMFTIFLTHLSFNVTLKYFFLTIHHCYWYFSINIILLANVMKLICQVHLVSKLSWKHFFAFNSVQWNTRNQTSIGKSFKLPYDLKIYKAIVNLKINRNVISSIFSDLNPVPLTGSGSVVVY